MLSLLASYAYKGQSALGSQLQHALDLALEDER